MKQISFYTDGACSGNPGAGGWAYLEISIEKTKEGSKINFCSKCGNKKETTNNEMELTAVYMALVKSYKSNNKKVTIYSDSAYVVSAIKKEWVKNWYYRDWKTVQGRHVKNQNIWEKIYKLIYEKGMQVTMVKVKGHDGDILNEYVDSLAVEEKQKIMEE